jgi:hypothetical protein
MITVSKLMSGSKKIRGSLSRVKDSFVELYYARPNSTKGCVMKFHVESEVEDKTYQVDVVFTKPTVVAKRTTGYKKIESGGVVYWVRPFEQKKSPVQVRCSCTDYRFTWYWWNKKNDAHTGKDFPAYTPTGDRPERNPLHVPGVCKHILGAFNVLRNSGLLK